jgi:hypothetical protein
MSHINFEAKTDRELLIITAQTVNNICENQIPEVVALAQSNRSRSRNNEAAINSLKCVKDADYIPSTMSRGQKLRLAAETKSGIIALVFVAAVKILDWMD